MWVNNVYDLQNISQNLGGNYGFANIDASATASWNSGAGFIPIGDAANPFTGTLVGNTGSTISNLTISSAASDVGLFGYVAHPTVIPPVYLRKCAERISHERAYCRHRTWFKCWRNRGQERRRTLQHLRLGHDHWQRVELCWCAGRVECRRYYRFGRSCHSDRGQRAWDWSERTSQGVLCSVPYPVTLPFRHSPSSREGRRWRQNVSVRDGTDHSFLCSAAHNRLLVHIPTNSEPGLRRALLPSFAGANFAVLGVIRPSHTHSRSKGPMSSFLEMVTRVATTTPQQAALLYGYLPSQQPAAQSTPDEVLCSVGDRGEAVARPDQKRTLSARNILRRVRHGRDVHAATACVEDYCHAPPSSPPAPATSTYTFEVDGQNIIVFRNGQRVSTTTPQQAALLFGYMPPQQPDPAPTFYVQSGTGAQLTLDQIKSGTFPPGTFFVESGTGTTYTAQQLAGSISAPAPPEIASSPSPGTSLISDEPVAKLSDKMGALKSSQQSLPPGSQPAAVPVTPSDAILVGEVLQAPEFWDTAQNVYDLVDFADTLYKYSPKQIVDTLEKLNIGDPISLEQLQTELISKAGLEVGVHLVADFLVDQAMIGNGYSENARTIAQSVVDTLINMATLDLRGQIVDQGVAVIKQSIAAKKDADQLADVFESSGLSAVDALALAYKEARSDDKETIEHFQQLLSIVSDNLLPTIRLRMN